MKTNLKKLFLVVAVAVPFMFTSCVESTDDVATIAFDGNITSITIVEGEDFVISGRVTSPEGTRIDDIAVRLVHGTHTHPIASNVRGDNTFTEVTNNNFTFRIDETHSTLAERLAHAIEAGATTATLEFEASVRNGGPATRKSITINLEQEVEYTPLSAPTAFTWERVGAANVEAMTQFGLSMITGGNATDGFTILVTAGTKLVRLETTDWTEITTREALAERIDAATPAVHAGTQNRIAFDRVTANINEVFGVLHNGNYYIFNATRTEINDAGAQNISRVIGNFKR